MAVLVSTPLLDYIRLSKDQQSWFIVITDFFLHYWRSQTTTQQWWYTASAMKWMLYNKTANTDLHCVLQHCHWMQMQSVSAITSDTYHRKEWCTAHRAAAAVVTVSGQKAAMCLSNHQHQYSLSCQSVTKIEAKVTGRVYRVVQKKLHKL